MHFLCKGVIFKTLVHLLYSFAFPRWKDILPEKCFKYVNIKICLGFNMSLLGFDHVNVRNCVDVHVQYILNGNSGSQKF